MKEQYLVDSYQKEYDATVESVKDGKFVIMDNTIFYPNSGGQPHDTGKIINKSTGIEYPVVYVGKFDDKISHEIDAKGKPELKQGDKVKCIIDWERRYKLMRSHTACHLVSGIISKNAGALITGNQIGIEKVRVDFNLETFDKEALKQYIDTANSMIESDINIIDYDMKKEDVEQNPEMIKLAKGIPQGIDVLRIIEIKDFDKQPDGGTHVKSLKEIGKIEFIKAENKGKNNRRMYFKLLD